MDLLNLTTTTTTTTDLYCSEDAGDLSSSPAPSSPPPQPILLSPDNTTPILSLLSSEHSFLPSLPHLLSLNPTLLHHSISYILKVSDLLHFRPVTPYLAINYLHRFLSSHSLPDAQGESGNGGGWALQLLTVACLSVAMKMVETHLPLLIDLQLLEPRFIFDTLTVRRMELLLMTALCWRLRAITPFDFLDFASSSALSSDARRFAGELIVNTSRVVDFLGFPPSIIAAAAIVCAQRRADPSAVHDDDLLGFLGDSVCKETVMGCCQLMHQYLIDTCPSSFGGKPCSEPIAPSSPSGVLDAATYGACSSDKFSSSASLAEPAQKRRRIEHR
ncbi:cyclin-D2-1-like isoform X1 [Dioscorea cayenensis subsp. rotundata]|uniref:Cyclin-D2-1-like isoform X1 n=1 Tax=Dioscorea cayennensis subsp. rotundata TaxID=55577 RepID=A0AB40CAY9_DIOCR|nr:cyclin-D2-1-like isoform X1 [Dioscorea cayenensis subsp. rotundata]